MILKKNDIIFRIILGTIILSIGYICTHCQKDNTQPIPQKTNPKDTTLKNAEEFSFITIDTSCTDTIIRLTE